jgi:uncharacterized protein YkwD
MRLIIRSGQFLFFFFTSMLIVLAIVSFAPANNSLSADVLMHTNQYRKSKGLPVLTMNTDLNAIAQQHSENMARGKVGFGHGGFAQRQKQAGKKISTLRSFAENVAYGANSGKEVVTMWKNSAGHRRNMLGKYKYIGIGTAKDRQGRIYYTQVFVN